MADYAKLLKLLESQDTRVYDDARQALRTHVDLGNGIRDLVKYYSIHMSERALELLCSIRDPHDKVLLDSLNEIFLKQTLSCTILLGQILQKGPSWVPKIAQHTLFKTILTFLTRSHSKRFVVEDIAVLLVISNLIPSCSSLPESALKLLFQAYITTCEMLRQRMRNDGPSLRDDADSVHFSHLHYAVREYFMTLYGIYPNQFIAFLRNYFQDPSEERAKIYRAIVRPMTTVVRLHPCLIEMTKEKELDKSRWAQREPHDFLDDCRKVMIGAIPISNQLGDGPASEAEETSTVMSDVYRTLFPSKSSGESSNGAAWENDLFDDDEEVSAALMSRIDTPPGTRSTTPMHKRSLDEPMVLDGKRRRSTGPSEEGTRRRSFRQTIGHIFTRSTTKMERAQTLEEVEIVGGAEDTDPTRRNSELEEGEDAMDSIEVERVETPHLQSGSSAAGTERTQPITLANGAEEARAAARRSVRGREMAENMLKGGTNGGDHAHTEEDPQPVSRSRSTTLMTVAGTGRSDSFGQGRLDLSEDDRATNGAHSEHHSSGDAARGGNDSTGSCMGGAHLPISESLPPDPSGRSRFSVTSFFNKLNRQRFRSECPPADEGGVAIMGAVTMMRGVSGDRMGASMLMGGGDEEDGVGGMLGMMMSNTSTLKRTSSCPILVDDGGGASMSMMAPSVDDHGAAATSTLKRPKMTTANLLDAFPYLTLLNEPSGAFFAQLEENLEMDHEHMRDRYIKASAEFHTKLKEMNLADRLPGKIYDDMSHILKGLPVEKQRDMLCTRLTLVNQHLLYERSCRLLHANRNRRLFGRIKQQKVYEAELRSYREKEANTMEDRKEWIKAMSDMRKQHIALKKQAAAKEQMLQEELMKRREEYTLMAANLEETNIVMRTAVAERDKFKAELDKARRHAEDAEVECRMMADKFEQARQECARVQVLSNELDQLRDDLIIAERRRREEGGGGAASPDWSTGAGAEERVRELEAMLERNRIDMDKMRRQAEELKQRKDEAESALKSETGRALEMRAKLDRAAKLLTEQKEAAEQKYLSLQMVVQKQEEFITTMFTFVESKEEQVKNTLKEMTRVDVEDDRSESYSTSPQAKDILPDIYISDGPAPFYFDPINDDDDDEDEVVEDAGKDARKAPDDVVNHKGTVEATKEKAL